MAHGDVQAVIRRNLRSKRLLASVRRKRSFDVSLFDPTSSGQPFERETFREFHRSILRPFLGEMLKCRVFHRDDSGLPDPEGRQARLERLGARPAEWRVAYTQDGEEKLLLLTPEVMDDELFWWWAITQPPSMRMVFLVTLAEFDWVAFFQHAYEPHRMGGSRPPELEIAKQETRRNGMAAFTIGNDLHVSVVASSPNIERLYQIAVDHAIVIPERHPFALFR
jgi:hypothetical protein